jgi:hypothetical protein
MQNRIRGWDLIQGILLSVIVLTACGQPQPPNGAGAQGAKGTGPRIALTPTTGAPNSPVTIDGAGFPLNTQIQIGFNSTTETRNPIQIGEVMANGTGEFKLIYIIPRTWQDGALITDDGLNITATSNDRSISVSALFNVTSIPGQTLAPPKHGTVTQPSMQGLPMISIAPPSGAAGTSVVVHGTGFPESTEVVIRMGIPGSGAMAQVYARTSSDNAGIVTVSFAIPAAWPDGKPIVEKHVVIVATTADGNSRALAEFSYNHLNDLGSPSPPIALTASSTVNPATSAPLATTRPITKPEGTAVFSPEPINTSVDFLNSLLRDPSGASSVAYLSQRLRSEISANWVLPTGLGIQPGYRAFQVTLLNNGEGSVVIQATLTYESGASVRNFTLIKEGVDWRIDKVVSGSR